MPGFLTEGSGNDEWREPVMAFADRHGIGAKQLAWPSRRLLDLLPFMRQIETKLGAPATLAAFMLLLGSGVYLTPPALLPLAHTLGLDVGVLFHALEQWRCAVQEADAVGRSPERWLRGVEGPVVLAGHSLGGRIALRVAEHARANNLATVLSMAPAVRARDLSYTRIATFARTVPINVLHSKADLVLQFAFRVGENTADHAIGYEGPPPMWSAVGSHKVQSLHIQYHKLALGALSTHASPGRWLKPRP